MDEVGAKLGLMPLARVRAPSLPANPEPMTKHSRGAQSRGAALDENIVDRARAALQLLKPCANLEHTHNYQVVLAAFAPQLVAADHRGADGRFDGSMRVSKGGAGVGVQARVAAPSLPLDVVVEIRADLDAAARGQCW